MTQKASITEIRRRSRRWGLPHIVTPSRHVENRHFLLLNPDPLEQERLLANPEWNNQNIIMCFEVGIYWKDFDYQFPIYVNWHVTSWVQSAVRSVMSEESALCDVLLWPQVTICFCKNLELFDSQWKIVHVILHMCGAVWPSQWPLPFGQHKQDVVHI